MGMCGCAGHGERMKGVYEQSTPGGFGKESSGPMAGRAWKESMGWVWFGGCSNTVGSDPAKKVGEGEPPREQTVPSRTPCLQTQRDAVSLANLLFAPLIFLNTTHTSLKKILEDLPPLPVQISFFFSFSLPPFSFLPSFHPF